MNNRLIILQKHLFTPAWAHKGREWVDVKKENLIAINPAHVSCVTPRQSFASEEDKRTHLCSDYNFCTLYVKGVHVDVDGTLDEVVAQLNAF
jgi:hypothetical protein